MEDALVSYKTALSAKEVGFDSDYVLQCYRKDGTLTLYSKQAHTHYTSVGKTIFEDFACLAPTQSILQKYLREIHNLEVIPFPRYNNSGELYYCYEIIKHSICRIEDVNEEMFRGVFRLYNTYEEAFEEGLFEALKIFKNEE